MHLSEVPARGQGETPEQNLFLNLNSMTKEIEEQPDGVALVFIALNDSSIKSRNW